MKKREIVIGAIITPNENAHIQNGRKYLIKEITNGRVELVRQKRNIARKSKYKILKIETVCANYDLVE